VRKRTFLGRRRIRTGNNWPTPPLPWLNIACIQLQHLLEYPSQQRMGDPTKKVKWKSIYWYVINQVGSKWFLYFYSTSEQVIIGPWCFHSTISFSLGCLSVALSCTKASRKRCNISTAVSIESSFNLSSCKTSTK